MVHQNLPWEYGYDLSNDDVLSCGVCMKIEGNDVAPEPEDQFITDCTQNDGDIAYVYYDSKDKNTAQFQNNYFTGPGNVVQSITRDKRGRRIEAGKQYFIQIHDLEYKDAPTDFSGVRVWWGDQANAGGQLKLDPNSISAFGKGIIMSGPDGWGRFIK